MCGYLAILYSGLSRSDVEDKVLRKKKQAIATTSLSDYGTLLYDLVVPFRKQTEEIGKS